MDAAAVEYRFFRLFVHSAVDGFICADSGGVIRVWSPGAHRLL